MTIRIPVAWGELHDKITILEIKAVELDRPEALANVRRELADLIAERDRFAAPDGLASLVAELARVNRTLWTVEDDIRDCERRQDFGPAFIALARSVYRTNDKRAHLKRQITALYGEGLREEKSYTAY
jgi:hypothetical protein